MHVHMTGGGGEAGPASRCPEAQVSNTVFLAAVISSAVMRRVLGPISNHDSHACMHAAQ